jgi:hypothetical protein
MNAPDSTVRFFPRSLRARIRPAVVLVSALIAIIWIAFNIKTARIQAKSAEKIESLGGIAFFDGEADARPRKILFPRLTGVAFYARSRLTDPDLTLLNEIPYLNELFLGHVKIGDESMPKIGQLKSLEGLELSAIPVTDEGVRNLFGLVNLRWLVVHNTSVTPAGVEKLRAALPNCKVDYVNGPERQRIAPSE